MFKTSEEFHQAIAELENLVERQEHGEITEKQLLYAWISFKKKAEAYIKTLAGKLN